MSDNNNNTDNDLSAQRKTLNGAWKLDKNRGEASLRGFLETMGVSELAIVAHEKGESEHETIHIIFLTDEHYKIKKLSRVNDLEEEFILNKESVKIYPPGDRKKVTLATSKGLHHVSIHTKMPTMNGLAEVDDLKTLLTSSEQSNSDPNPFPSDAASTDVFLLQELTIKNIAANKSHTSRRYYKPYYDETGVLSSDKEAPPPDTAASKDFMEVAEDED